MSDSNIYQLKVEGWKVKTIVVSNDSQLTSGLRELLSDIGSERNVKRVVGLDIERSYFVNCAGAAGPIEDRVALLKLSTHRCCLLIQLWSLDTCPSALANFLGLIDVTFVGVGIKFCFELLEKQFRLKCRNQVDLVQLAKGCANRNYGGQNLADLAEEVCLVSMGVKAHGVVCSDRRSRSLSREQMESAATDGFMCFLVGNRLLGGFDPPKETYGADDYGYSGYDY